MASRTHGTGERSVCTFLMRLRYRVIGVIKHMIVHVLGRIKN